MSSDPIAWIRSTSDPTRIFPLRPYPHPTTIGRHEDCDIMLTPQSVSRHHCCLQLASNSIGNSAAVAVLKDTSFNGCFVGDDLVRNRAEWIARGDTIRFGNDKEKFVLETIAVEGEEEVEGEGGRHGEVGRLSGRENDAGKWEGAGMSPIDERNQHGGEAAGIKSKPSDHIRQIHPAENALGGSPREAASRGGGAWGRQGEESATKRGKPNIHAGGGTGFEGREVGKERERAPWASMAIPPRPSPPEKQHLQNQRHKNPEVISGRGGQAWTIPTAPIGGDNIADHPREGAGDDPLATAPGGGEASMFIDGGGNTEMVDGWGAGERGASQVDGGGIVGVLGERAKNIYGGSEIGISAGSWGAQQYQQPQPQPEPQPQPRAPQEQEQLQHAPQQPSDLARSMPFPLSGSNSNDVNGPQIAWGYNTSPQRIQQDLSSPQMQYAQPPPQYHYGQAQNQHGILQQHPPQQQRPQNERPNSSGSSEIPSAPPLPTGDLPSLDGAGSKPPPLTAEEIKLVEEERKLTAKHMRDLNMLLAGSMSPDQVEFVFVENDDEQDPRTGGIDNTKSNEYLLGMSQNGSRTSLRMRSSTSLVNKEREREMKLTHDRDLIKRCLGVLEKHKVRGLSKAWNKWKVEVRAINMSRAEKKRLKEIEELQTAANKKLEEQLAKEQNDNKCRSAIQLMIDSKKKGKQMQLLAGFNTWKHFVVGHKKSEFSDLIRAKDCKGGVDKVLAMLRAGKVKQVMKGWNKWREFVSLCRGAERTGESDLYLEKLKKKGEKLKSKIIEQEKQIRDLNTQLDNLKVNDWASALNTHQKIVQNLRRQLARSERGWRAECAAFAAAVCNVGEYIPGENAASGADENNSNKGNAHGSGLGAVLQQRKLKNGMGGKLKERMLSSKARKNQKVRQIQTYIVNKAREIASVRRECEEWRRRTEASSREWASICEERNALNVCLEDCKAGSVQQAAHLLDMVRERDQRIMKLQDCLVKLASMKDKKDSGVNTKGGTGNLKNGMTTATGGKPPVSGESKPPFSGESKAKQVKILSRRQQAASFLLSEFNDMQAECANRTEQFVNQLIELRAVKQVPSKNHLGLPAGGNPGIQIGALNSKILQLEDQIHESQVQGGVAALIEAQELIEALQSELSINDRKCRALEQQLAEITADSRGGAGGRGGGGEGRRKIPPLSGRSTPSLLPNMGEPENELTSQFTEQLADSADRLRSAASDYDKELMESNLIGEDDFGGANIGEGGSESVIDDF